MSGGTFDYKQYELSYIADQIEEYIYKNGNDNNHDENTMRLPTYAPMTIEEFRKAVTYLRIAETYAQRIDWLLAGDDSERTFHERIKEDLSAK